MVMDVNQTYSGDHFAIPTNIESLCGTLETNIMSYVSYTSKQTNKQTNQLSTTFCWLNQ